MKITEVMYSGLGAKQVVFAFNKENHTDIISTYEVKEGITFVTIDFRDATKEEIFRAAYLLGKTQKRLMKSGDIILPVEEFPFPPEESNI